VKAMTRILVAEDSPTQAAEIRMLLQAAGHEVIVAKDGQDALEILERQLPDLVLTDLDMPRLTGLELTEAVSSKYPRLPVVLMTAFGTDDTAIQALEHGAASYVPKRNIPRDLIATIADVMSVVQSDLEEDRVSQHLVEAAAEFCLENDAQLIGPVVAYIQETMDSLKLVDATQRVRVGVAIEEALRSALFQGNLELTSSQLRDAYHLEDGGRSYYQMLDERRKQVPYRDRRIHVCARVTKNESVCTVRDEGAGFAVRNMAQLDDSHHLAQDDNRGFLLMKSFMDEVRFSDSGHEITLIKRAAK
jgi:CheY-like chemotaxis protein